MEWLILFEVLKALWLAFEVRNYFIQREKEKTMLEEVETLKHRLNHLEKVKKSKKLDS